MLFPPNYCFLKTSLCWEGKNRAGEDPEKCNNMVKKMEWFLYRQKKKSLFPGKMRAGRKCDKKL